MLSDQNSLMIERINDILLSFKKRIRARDFLDYDGGLLIKRYYFRLENRKHLIVTTEAGYVKSILVQVQLGRPYTVQLNGQVGRNTAELFMDFYCERRLEFNFSFEGIEVASK